MADFTERRKYQRCTETICKVIIHTNGRHRQEVQTEDISAGGMKFSSSKMYDVNDILHLHLTVYSGFSEFNMNLDGLILRREAKRNGYVYGVKFQNINKYQQIQLDEIIKAKISLKNDIGPLYEDGIYAFMFIPKTKKRMPSIYR